MVSCLKRLAMNAARGAVDADLIRKGFGGEPQPWVMVTEHCENGCRALDAQLRRSVEGEKQRGMTGLGSCDKGSQLAEAEMLGLINEEQIGLTGEGCRVDLASGMDAPTVCATEAALVLRSKVRSERAQRVHLQRGWFLPDHRAAGFCRCREAAERVKQVSGYFLRSSRISSLTDCWLVVRKYCPLINRALSRKGEMR